jgi:hypothetical protein
MSTTLTTFVQIAEREATRPGAATDRRGIAAPAFRPRLASLLRRLLPAPASHPTVAPARRQGLARS